MWLWDAHTGQELSTLKGNTYGVTSVTFQSRRTVRLATGSSDRTARLWDTQMGQELLAFQGHTNRVNCVSFSPDGQRLATASDDRTARLWDMQGHELLNLKGHTNRVTSVSFSPDGQRLAARLRTRQHDCGTCRVTNCWPLRGILTASLA